MGPEIDLHFQTEVRDLELKFHQMAGNFHQMAASHLVMKSVIDSNFGQIDKNLGLVLSLRTASGSGLGVPP